MYTGISCIKKEPLLRLFQRSATAPFINRKLKILFFESKSDAEAMTHGKRCFVQSDIVLGIEEKKSYPGSDHG
jgi:hypothetical protein